MWTSHLPHGALMRTRLARQRNTGHAAGYLLLVRRISLCLAAKNRTTVRPKGPPVRLYSTPSMPPGRVVVRQTAEKSVPIVFCTCSVCLVSCGLGALHSSRPASFAYRRLLPTVQDSRRPASEASFLLDGGRAWVPIWPVQRTFSGFDMASSCVPDFSGRE